MMARRSTGWLRQLAEAGLSVESVNEIYRGEDSIVRHRLKAPWNMGWLAAGCGAYAGGSGWGAQDFAARRRDDPRGEK
ncbi:hypothetical protein ACNKHM_05190 [Shigella sonnei]